MDTFPPGAHLELIDPEDADGAIQVIAYLNHINRIAEGGGTDAEPEWEPRLP